MNRATPESCMLTMHKRETTSTSTNVVNVNYKENNDTRKKTDQDPLRRHR